MIEIIPNWHPLFVHFTLALLFMATVFYAGAVIGHGWAPQLLLVARWNLFVGILITGATLIAGLHAYNTVPHDAASHVAMTDHRNWALATAGSFMLIALWEAVRIRLHRCGSYLVMVALLAGSGLLIVTGFKGTEIVYRYGLGVLSLPRQTADADAERVAPPARSSQPADTPAPSAPTADETPEQPAAAADTPHTHGDGEAHAH